jgi:hypothetical protein
MIEHLDVRFLEEISIRVIVVQRADEESVDSEECSKLFIEV